MTIHMRSVLREFVPAFYLEPCFFLMEIWGSSFFADLWCHMKEQCRLKSRHVENTEKIEVMINCFTRKSRHAEPKRIYDRNTRARRNGRGMRSKERDSTRGRKTMEFWGGDQGQRRK